MDAVRATAPKLSEPATAVAHAWLRASIYRELEAEAARRREHPDQVAAQIVTAALLLGRVDELIEDAIAGLRS